MNKIEKMAVERLLQAFIEKSGQVKGLQHRIWELENGGTSARMG